MSEDFGEEKTDSIKMICNTRDIKLSLRCSIVESR